MTTEDDRYTVRPGRPSDAVELARLHASVQLQAALRVSSGVGSYVFVTGLAGILPGLVAAAWDG